MSARITARIVATTTTSGQTQPRLMRGSMLVRDSLQPRERAGHVLGEGVDRRVHDVEVELRVYAQQDGDDRERPEGDFLEEIHVLEARVLGVDGALEHLLVAPEE